MTALVSCFEHQHLRRSDFVHDSDFDWLLQHMDNECLPCFALKLQRGELVLVVRHYLAVICLPSGTLLEILPKISRTAQPQHTRQWVARMFRDIYGLSDCTPASSVPPVPLLSPSSQRVNVAADARMDEHWLQSLVSVWLSLLVEVLPYLPRHYHSQQYNHPQSRGKLLLKQQLSYNAHRPHYRYASQDQLRVDPLWYAFFATVVRQVQRLGIRVADSLIQAVQSPPQQSIHDPTAVLSRHLSNGCLAMSQWQSSYQQLSQHLGSSHAQLSAPRIATLRQVLEMAWLLLKCRQPSFASDAMTSTMPSCTTIALPSLARMSASDPLLPVLMLDMQQAFERWVLVAVRRWAAQKQSCTQSALQTSAQTSVAPAWQVRAQVSRDWLWALSGCQAGNTAVSTTVSTTFGTEATTSLSHRIRPDIVIETSAAGISHVIEVKYKHIEHPSQVASQDLYQLAVYQQQCQAQHAWLVLPKHQRFNQPCYLYAADLPVTAQHLQDDGKDGKTVALCVLPFCYETGRLLIN